MTVAAIDRSAENAARRKWLVRTLVAYEVTTITVCLFVAFTIATAQGGSPLMALPLVLISAAEIMRITLAAWIVRLGWLQKALGLVVLLAISIASAEGLVLAFESAVQARVQNVANAEHRVALAQVAVDEETARRAEFVASAEAARRDVASLDAAIAAQLVAAPAPPPAASKTCTGRNGRAISCGDSTAAQQTYAVARKSYDTALTALREQRKEAQARVVATIGEPVGISAAQNELLAAKRAYAAEAAQSPMHRIAAAVFGTGVAAVSPEQFEAVKKWAVFGLAIAFATMSALVSFVAYSDPVDAPRGKLARAIRAWAARRRKSIVAVREVPGPERIVEREVEKVVEVPGPERIVEKEVEKEVPVETIRIIYIPVDHKAGKRRGKEKEIVADDPHPLLRPLQGGRS